MAERVVRVVRVEWFWYGTVWSGLVDERTYMSCLFLRDLGRSLPSAVCAADRNLEVVLDRRSSVCDPRLVVLPEMPCCGFVKEARGLFGVRYRLNQSMVVASLELRCVCRPTVH